MESETQHKALPMTDAEALALRRALLYHRPPRSSHCITCQPHL